MSASTQPGRQPGKQMPTPTSQAPPQPHAKTPEARPAGDQHQQQHQQQHQHQQQQQRPASEQGGAAQPSQAPVQPQQAFQPSGAFPQQPPPQLNPVVPPAAVGNPPMNPNTAYAQRIRFGQSAPKSQPKPGVHQANVPVLATGNSEMVNRGLEVEVPRQASFVCDPSRFYANLDQSSFCNAAFGMRSGMGSMMFGSMYGGGMGGPMRSMFGMPGSMYGGPMMGSFMSRPPSMYSQYGGPMSMYRMGSMVPGGSFYGMNFAPNGGMGSMYRMDSNYGGMNPYQSIMNPYGPPGFGPGTEPFDAREAPGAMPDSKGAAPLHTTLLLAPVPPTPNSQHVDASPDASAPGKSTVIIGQQPVTSGRVDEVLTGPAPMAMSQWLQGPACRRFIENITGGHNVSLIVGGSNVPAAMQASHNAVHTLLVEVLRAVALSLQSSGPDGYAEGQLYCCSIKSATEALDLVAGGAAYTPLSVGSNPLFGPGFLNMKTAAVPISPVGQSRISEVMQRITPAVREKDPVQVVQLILKQATKQKPAAEAAAQPDLLVSSVTIFISNAQADFTSPFFGVLRNAAIVPSALTKGPIGGACYTLVMLSLPDSTLETTKATAAVESLLSMQNTSNEPPRSGSLSRFITHATSETSKQGGPQGAASHTAQRLTDRLADARELLAKPRELCPKVYALTKATTPAATAGIAAASPAQENSNPIRTALVVGIPARKHGKETIRVLQDGFTIADASTGTQARVDEIITREPEDWRSTVSEQANDIQGLFQNGHNTAVIGTVSPSEINPLDKQPLWLSYKRMVSSLLSVASSKYKFAEVTISMALIEGNDQLADLLASMDPDAGEIPAPKKLSVALSPLFGPTVNKATTIKPPTPLQLESTINGALYQVPALLKKRKSNRSIIFASSVLKGVTADGDVVTNSLIGASTSNPAVFVDILNKQSNVPFDLFDFALGGGPCGTLFLGDVNQGDGNVGEIIQLLGMLSQRSNKPSRACSVRGFVAYAKETLERFDSKLANAPSEKEREVLMKNRKSMEVFFNDHSALCEDPQHRDPKTYYRKTGAAEDSPSTGKSSSEDKKKKDKSSTPSNKAESDTKKGSKKVKA